MTDNVLPFRRPAKKAPDLTQIMLRTSERKTFKRCPAQWWWRYRQGLVPVIENPGALWFGTGLHLVWQNYYKKGYKRGKTPLKTWRDYVGDTQANVYQEDADGTLNITDAATLGEAMIGRYLDLYQGDKNWYVYATEYPFEYDIPMPGGRSIRYCGKLDLVARNDETDEVFIWDHKHMKSIDTRYLVLDDQAGSYWAVAPKVLIRDGIMPKGTELAGILFNFLRKAMPDERPQNERGEYTNQPTKAHYEAALQERGLNFVGTLATLKERAENAGLLVLGDVSKRQPPPYFHREMVWRTPPERRTQFNKIVNEALHMNMVRERKLPIIKNPTSDCSWDCPFVVMCEMQENQGDWREFRGLAYKREDPYADHR